MLQKLDGEQKFQDAESDADFGYLLEPAYYLGLIKRRLPFFLVPFLFVLLLGGVITYLWPAQYFSEGKILVQSQQIPTELVRPTVTSAAQERIQVIEQRTMTRDVLLAIADKFKLFPERRNLMSPTQLVELMKKSIKIQPVTDTLSFARNTQNPTIIFTVGFEYGDPQIAARVANDLVTRILDLDLRDRTGRASDTTKFLAREVQRLQAESSAIDAKMALAKVSPVRTSSRASPDQGPSQLAQLRSELAQKSAVYSDRNFQIQALKRQIEALEKVPAPLASAPSAPEQQPTSDLDALEVQQKSVQLNLDAASQKLVAARLGETLERDQQSEKLEVIDQPTQPQEPVSPNRPKLAGIVAILALMFGGGIAGAAELFDRAIRRSSDLFSVIDRELISSIPFMRTKAELRRRRRKFWFVIVAVIVLLGAAAFAAYWLLPPLDLIIAKARVGIFK